MNVPVAAEKAYRASIDATTSEIANELQAALGQKLLAFMLNTRPQTVGEWAASKTIPRRKGEEDLRHVSHIYNLLAGVDDKPTIRSWFAGMNPMLGDDAPAEVIARGEFKAALGAARAFVITS